MEQEESGGVWTAVRSDSHPSTTFEWVRNDTLLGTSTVTLSWTIEQGTPGVWRLFYFLLSLLFCLFVCSFVLSFFAETIK